MACDMSAHVEIRRWRLVGWKRRNHGNVSQETTVWRSRAGA